MMQRPLLLPHPRRLELGSGVFRPAGGVIRIAARADELLMTSRLLQNAMLKHVGQMWPIAAGAARAENEIRIELTRQIENAEGYTLDIRPNGIVILANQSAGAFYGAQTLVQLLRQYPRALPAMHIADHPDFPARGVMLDISRDKVPSMATLFGLVDQLTEWKINQLQLYTEHTFAYRGHPQVWAQASPMTGEQVLELDRYCRERFIALVPNQNSFGHMDRWLKLPKYKPLAEAPEGFTFPWGAKHEQGFSLCPTDPGSIRLIGELFDELLPHFTSALFNVGCDETFDLGEGRSKVECGRLGRERVYLDFLLKVYELVKKHGRTMQFWGDIILHKPELIRELPTDVIALEWGYEANHPFDRDGALFRQAGVPFYVCPGTSSWLTIAGRTDNAICNLKSAASNGLKHGAIGFLNTDWGDHGHLQYLPVSHLGFAAGAAYSWSLETNADLPLPEVLSLHAFQDSAGVMGKLAYDLGNVYLATGKLMSNKTALFQVLTTRADDTKATEGLTPDGLDASEKAINQAMQPLDDARMQRCDAALIRDEFRNASAMLRHACRRGHWRLAGCPDCAKPDLATDLRQIIGEHRRLWLERNRPGGLCDSVARIALALAEYEA